MNIDYNRLFSHKLIVALISVMSCSILMYAEKISDGVYSTIMVSTVAAFLAAHVIQDNNNKETPK